MGTEHLKPCLMNLEAPKRCYNRLTRQEHRSLYILP